MRKILHVEYSHLNVAHNYATRRVRTWIRDINKMRVEYTTSQVLGALPISVRIFLQFWIISLLSCSQIIDDTFLRTWVLCGISVQLFPIINVSFLQRKIWKFKVQILYWRFCCVNMGRTNIISREFAISQWDRQLDKVILVYGISNLKVMFYSTSILNNFQTAL
jgi:hypothetical protein